MEKTTLLSYFAGIIIVFLIGKVFIVPAKKILKLLLNSIIGGVIIFVINVVGESFGLHIGLNIITAAFVGFLGIPGAIVLVLVKLLIG